MFSCLKAISFSAVFSILFLVYPAQVQAAEPILDLTPIHEAFVPKFQYPAPLAVPKAPPAPIVENPPSRPHPDAVWIPGYWAWVQAKNDFAWICGVWRRPPPGQIWILGNWNSTPKGWIWGSGFWSAVQESQLKLINTAPPQPISDKIPASPGSSYFFAPGYWSYAENTQNYSWLSGKWELGSSSWVLAPACYYWRPSGYVFVPFYWDFPLEQRGTAYTCQDARSPLVVIETRVILESLFYCYPDYQLFYWHWWTFHPGWQWGGCGCVPPWWFWNDWWFLGWNDSWGLWWWWGHPGDFAPFWLTLELSMEIAPPPLAILDALKKLPKPHFDLKLGDKALLPKGTEGKKSVPLPQNLNDIQAGGTIALPSIPNQQVTPPPPPPPPPEPSYVQPEPLYPSSTYYPENEPPRGYYPSNGGYYNTVPVYPNRPLERHWPQRGDDHDRGGRDGGHDGGHGGGHDSDGHRGGWGDGRNDGHGGNRGGDSDHHGGGGRGSDRGGSGDGNRSSYPRDGGSTGGQDRSNSRGQGNWGK